MEKTNLGIPDDSSAPRGALQTSPPETQTSVMSALKAIVKKKRIIMTCGAIQLLFVIGNFFTFGLAYFWPNEIRRERGAAIIGPPAMELFVLRSWGLPATLLSLFCVSESLGPTHRRTVFFCFLITSLSLLAPMFIKEGPFEATLKTSHCLGLPPDTKDSRTTWTREGAS